MKSPLTCLLTAVFAAAPSGAQQAERPRLVVLCCVDQLATWVYAAGAPHLAEDGGFRRLLREGVYFEQCAYEHACTETGPGHATIGTGAPAAVHGIVRNNWWSPPDQAVVYCVEQPAEPLPGMLDGRDRGPKRLIAETLSEVMRREIPGTKVASVSWKDRSAILMVGKHADVAAWIELQNGDLVTNKTWCAEVPPWIARFNADHFVDSFHGTKWTRTGPASAYEGLVDARPFETPHLNGDIGRTLPAALTGGKDEPDYGYYNQIYYSPMGNVVVRRAAEACIEAMDLGADSIPDLMAVSFSSTDLVGHHFGGDSVEARDALLRLDRQLAKFFDFLDRRVGKGHYSLFMTADHGLARTPEWCRARGIDAGRGLIQSHARAIAEIAITKRFGRGAGDRRYCSHVGEWALVFDKAAFDRGDGDAAASRRFEQACEIAAKAVPQARGIIAAYTTRDILGTDPGTDPYRIALRAALHPDRAGDVQLIVRPNWLDGVVTASHGTPHPYDREVVGFAMGAGVPAGLKIDDPITPGFGAVLFAHLLGIARPEHAVDQLPAAFSNGK